MASYKKLKSGWQYRVSYKDGGKYRTKSGNGFTTKAEAQVAAREIENYLFRGDKLNQNPVFAKHFKQWYELFKKDKYSAKNNKDIEHAVTVATRHFKQTKIKEIDRKSYQTFLNTYGEGRVTSTVKKVHIYCKACLMDALDEGIIHRDPTKGTLIKGTKEGKREEEKFLSKDETTKLVKEVKKGMKPEWQSRYIILLAIATGMRFSEILALKWADIDFDEQTISIYESFDHVLTKKIVETKTKSSKRTISVDKTMLSLLKKYKIATQLTHPEYVFMDTYMNHTSNSACNKALKRACKRSGIKQITFHSLRHAHCSLLIYEGMNIKYISKRLGHSSIITTYQIYGHIIDEMELKQNEKLDQIMSSIHNAK